jgi:Zn-dependent protease
MWKYVPEWIQLKRVAVFGAPIFVHWTVFVVVGALALIALGNPLFAVLFIACYLAIIFVHEVGHALVAHRLGCRVRSISMTFWHGECVCEAPETEWENALIAWGGAALQLLMAIPALLIMVWLGDRDWGYWTPVIVFLGYFNIALAVANLLPGDECDGDVAWRVVPIFLEMQKARRAKRRVQMPRSWRG